MERTTEKKQDTANDFTSPPWQRPPMTLYDRLLQNREKRQPPHLRRRLMLERHSQETKESIIESKQNNIESEILTEKNTNPKKNKKILLDKLNVQDKEELPTPQQLKLIRQLLKTRNVKNIKKTVKNSEQNIGNRSSIEWWEDDRAKDLINKINDLNKMIEEKQNLLNDYNEKQKSIGPLELYAPGEYTVKFINLIVKGVEYLSEDVHEAAGFTFLTVSPILVALGTPGALLLDAYKTIERDIKDVFKLGPPGRYISKSESSDILSKIDAISKKIVNLRKQLEDLNE